MKLNQIQSALKINTPYFQVANTLMEVAEQFYGSIQKDLLNFLVNQINEEHFQKELAEKLKKRVFNQDYCNTLDKKLEEFLEYKFTLKHFLETEGKDDDKVLLLFGLVEQMCKHLRNHSEYYRFNKNQNDTKEILQFLFLINKTLNDWHNLFSCYQEQTNIIDFDRLDHTSEQSDSISFQFAIDKKVKQQSESINHFILFWNTTLEILSLFSKQPFNQSANQIANLTLLDDHLSCVILLDKNLKEHFFQIIDYFMIEGLSRDHLIKHIIKILNQQENIGLKNDKINNLSKKYTKQLSALNYQIKISLPDKKHDSVAYLKTFIGHLQKNNIKIDEIFKSSEKNKAEEIKEVKEVKAVEKSEAQESAIEKKEVEESPIAKETLPEEIAAPVAPAPKVQPKTTGGGSSSKGNIHKLFNS